MFVQTLSQRLSESYSVTLRVPPAPSPLKHVCALVSWMESVGHKAGVPKARRTKSRGPLGQPLTSSLTIVSFLITSAKKELTKP